MTDVPAEIVEHYETEDEHLRLTTPKGRIELLRTQRILRSVLPPSGHVLDVGGGTGVYAAWLAGLGYEVDVVDATPKHVAQCRAQGLRAEVGDARALDRADASSDAVLLLGPLYHLQDRADRVIALREAHRVLRPGGVVGAAVISRFAGWLDGLLRAVPVLQQHRSIVEQELADGRHDPPAGIDMKWFTTAYFHHPDEVATELIDAGFADVDVRAVEGPTWLMPGDIDVGAIVELLDPIDREPTLIGASAHIVATARKISEQ